MASSPCPNPTYKKLRAASSKYVEVELNFDGEELVVGHRLPEEVAEPAGDLVVAQRDVLAVEVTADLQSVEELGALEHGGHRELDGPREVDGRSLLLEEGGGAGRGAGEEAPAVPQRRHRMEGGGAVA